MSHAFDQTRAADLSRVSLRTGGGNAGARRLNEILGMKPIQTRKVTETVEWVQYELDL